MVILAIDINPSIERKYSIDKIPKTGEIIAESSSHNPGGSGSIIGMFLDLLNEDILITGFLGGINGEYYHESLVERDTMHKVVTIKDEIRTTIEILNEKNEKIIISEKGPRITREEIESFYVLYSELIDESDVIIGGSSLPQGVDKDIYYNLINISNRKEKVFILDARGEELRRGIDACPFIVIISKKELESLIKLKLNLEEDLIKAGKYIIDKGIKILVVNLGEKGILVLEESKGYKVDYANMKLKLERFDNTGIAAGFAIGIKRSYDFEMTLKLAQAFNIVYTRENDISLIDMIDIKRHMNKIEVETINY